MTHIFIPFEFAGKPEGMLCEVIEEPTNSTLTKMVVITIAFADLNEEDLEEEPLGDAIADIAKMPIALKRAVIELQETDELQHYQPDARALMIIEVDGFDKRPNVVKNGKTLTKWEKLTANCIKETFMVC